MTEYDYLRPTSVEEALGLLQMHQKGAMLIAGGTDVIVGIRKKKIAPQILISLKSVDGLEYIRSCETGIEVGSMTTHRSIAESAIVRRRYSALSDASGRVGSLQIRNVATIGGNISSSLPSADTACPLLIFDTQVRLKSSSGERLLPLDQFFLGPGRTALHTGEILSEFVIPPPPAISGSCYKKVGRREAMEIAVLGIAMMISADVVNSDPLKEALSGKASFDQLYEAIDASEIYCREARIALGVAAPTPIRARAGEAVLKNVRLTAETLLRAGEAAAGEAKPRDTMRGEAWFRSEMIRVLPRRLAISCLERIMFPVEGPAREVSA